MIHGRVGVVQSFLLSTRLWTGASINFLITPTHDTSRIPPCFLQTQALNFKNEVLTLPSLLSFGSPINCNYINVLVFYLFIIFQIPFAYSFVKTLSFVVIFRCIRFDLTLNITKQFWKNLKRHKQRFLCQIFLRKCFKKNNEKNTQYRCRWNVFPSFDGLAVIYF